MRLGWTDVAAAAGVVVLLLLRPWYPVGAWLAPLVFAAIYFHARFWSLERTERKWIALCSLAAAGIYLLIATTAGIHNPLRVPEKSDDYDYFVQAQSIAEAWRNGLFPELTRKGSLPYLGTLHTGYQRILASAFLILGSHVWVGMLLNAAALAFLPLMAYLLVSRLFSPAAFATTTPPTGSAGILTAFNPNLRACARAAALFCAIHPSFHYWGTWLLKDLLLTALFACALLLLVDCVLERRPVFVIGFLLVFAWVAIFRAYAALALVAGVVLYAVARLPRRAVIWSLIYLFAGLAVATYSTRIFDYLNQLLHSLGSLLPSHVEDVKSSILYIATGLPRLLLGPYAWIRAYGPLPQYGLYPGMWFLYLLIYPLSLCALIRTIRLNHVTGILPIGAFASSAFIFLLAYGGDAPRQRLYLEFILICYAAYGWGAVERRKWYFIAWYALVFLFAAVQYSTLHLRY